MSKKTVIIQGSARSTGNTSKVVAHLQDVMQAEVIDLKSFNFSGYDYDHNNTDDDFLSLMRSIVGYDNIIFATPVYWYSMSGLMKNFFDRITDCLKIDKDTGRKLRGKTMGAISCGSDAIETEGFFIPFKNSAEYLGMHYSGNIHVWLEGENFSPKVLKRLSSFSDQIK